MRYADAAAVAAGFRTLTDEEQARADALLEEAAVLIDAVAADAKEDAKWVVSCRMVRRVLGDGTGGDMPLYPMGASQGSATALGYTQSWTMSGGTSGELYISRTERRLLGAGKPRQSGIGGDANHYGASDSHGVRPFFCIRVRKLQALAATSKCPS